VDFKNTILIMTSNIGSCFLPEGMHDGEIADSVRESVMAELRKAFRPGFRNRIDETILFKPLTLEEITSSVNLLLVDLDKRLAERRVTVKLDRKAKDWRAEKGCDPVFGARPLKRFLQRNIETRLARALIAAEVGEGTGDAAVADTVWLGYRLTGNRRTTENRERRPPRHLRWPSASPDEPMNGVLA